ncbi:MAG: PHP domain-containing protein [Candidatus Hodarchaeota archaeon]
MKPASDFHVHTHYSGCCKETYGIKEAWNAARERGVETLGISDHDVPFKNQHLKKQRVIVSELENVMLGLEVSIRDGNGKIMVSRENLELLDYFLISEHIHIMPSWTLMKKGRKNFTSWWKNPQERYKIEKFYKKHAMMTFKALERNKPDILAHPWRYPWHGGILDKATLDVYEKVLQKAAKLGVRIELSRSVMNLVISDIEGRGVKSINIEEFPSWKGEMDHELMQPLEFFKRYAKNCLANGVEFSLGSDAHKLAEIGNFPNIDNFIKVLDIPENKIVQTLK